MASCPITSWQLDGGTMETVSDFILGDSKITADGDCCHEIKRRLLLGRKAMTNLDSIFKSRDITLPTKVRLVKAMVFPVVMYGSESWTIKKAECRRIDAFELWCWRRLLRVSWTDRRSNQSILKEISPEYSLEGLMLKLNSNTLATWWEEPTHWKRPWCWGRLKAGGEGDDRGWDGWEASPTRWTWVWVGSRSWWWIGRPGLLQSMGSQRVRHNWVTELNWIFKNFKKIDTVSNSGGLRWDSRACTSNKFWGDMDGPGTTLWEPWWHSAWRMFPATSMACIWGQERQGRLGEYPAFSHHPRCPQAVSSSTEHLGGTEAEGTRLNHTKQPHWCLNPCFHISSNKTADTYQVRLPHLQLFLILIDLSSPTYGCQTKHRVSS